MTKKEGLVPIHCKGLSRSPWLAQTRPRITRKGPGVPATGVAAFASMHSCSSQSD